MILLCATSLNWVGLNLLNFFYLPPIFLIENTSDEAKISRPSFFFCYPFLPRSSFFCSLILQVEQSQIESRGIQSSLSSCKTFLKFKTDLRKQPGFSLRPFGCCVSLTDRRFRLIQSVKSDVAKSDSSYILFFGIHFSRKWVFKGSIQDSKDFERA